MSNLLALTLWRPWPFAILHLPEGEAKRVENRPWKPWASVIGKRIALHAGKHMDDNVLRTLFPLAVDVRAYDEGILGTAVVKGWICNEDSLLQSKYDYGGTLTAADAEAAYDSRWFFGPYGWVLEDVRALPEPIPCKGAQGLWTVPAAIAALLPSPTDPEPTT